MYNFKVLINGKFFDSSNYVEIINPANLKPSGRVPSLQTEDIDEAFCAAKKAQKSWSELSLFSRIKYIKDFNSELKHHMMKIGEIITSENGKPLNDSISEVRRTMEYIDYTIEEAKRLQPETLTGDGFGISNKIGIFKRVPRGVILAISPFNYPINLAISKIIPALVTGNSVVFKPATNGSLTGAYLAFLFHKVNFPPGVINVVTGRGRDIGDMLISHQNIDVISFTGSVEIGERIKKLNHHAELILELGGKDPMLVCQDANLDKVAKDIIAGGFAYSGQRCTAIKLVVADNAIADELISKLSPLVNELTVGSGFDNSYIVPLITPSAADYVQSLIDDAILKKAILVCGNKRKENLIYPTVLDHVTTDMRVAYEEPFGPVLPIIRVNSTDQMISIANNSDFGLQASIYTNDINKALKIADALDVGTVNLNGKSQRGPDSFPFLGVKKSGMGVQGIKDTLLSCTRPKGIVINY